MANNKPTEREELKLRADLMHLDYPGNISTANLRNLVNAELDPQAVVEVDPQTTGGVAEDAEDTTDEAVEVKAEAKPAKKAPGKAKVLTEMEIVSQRTAELRREMMSLVRVIVSCNDPQMKEWETTPPLSISNAIITLPKVVVPLNTEWHVPKAYYDMLKAQKCGIAVKSKDNKGRPITMRKEINKYNVNDLGAISKEDLKTLMQAQANRDGVA